MTGIIARQIKQTPDPARRAPGPVLPGELALQDGTPALIWPLLPTDAGTLRDLFRRLSPESRHYRFLQVLDQLDDPMIRRLVDGVDGARHVALLLTVLPPGGREEPVGVARLVQDADDPATADIAVTVVDEWQRRGAGTLLVSALMERRPAAVTRLHTVVEAGNRGSLTLLSRIGQMSSELPEQGVQEVIVELPRANRARTTLKTAPRLWAQAAQKLLAETPLVPWRPSAGVIPAMADYVEFVQRMAEINRELTVKLAEAATGPFGVVYDPARADAGRSAGPVRQEN
jgi:RimJ/RimL family protein N-acetyltransferase